MLLLLLKCCSMLQQHASALALFKEFVESSQKLRLCFPAADAGFLQRGNQCVDILLKAIKDS